MKKAIYLILAVFFSSSTFSQLDLIETTDMKMVTYDFGHQYLLPHATRCFHGALEFHKKLFDYTPSEKITVLIQDFGDYGNAGATAVPKNAVSMGLSPFSYAFETNPAGERIFSMMNHELIHVVALDNASGSDNFYKGMFMGKVSPTSDHPISMFYSYLTSPRRYSPRWYHEGLAAYIETWMGGGLGLALGSYDEMVFRTKVLENDRIYSAQGLESEGVTTDFQGRSNSYLYGTRFMGYLAYTYGPENIIEWGKRTNGTKRGFAGQFKNVFKKSIGKAWNDWIEFENEFQNQNLNTLKEFPITKMQKATEESIGSVSYPHYDSQEGKVYMAVNYPGQFPHIASLDLKTGKVDKLVDIKGPALFYVSSLTYDSERKIIYYTTDNDQWRDLNAYDVRRDETKLLQKDFRTGDLAFNTQDNSIWGIKHLNGISTIIKVPASDESRPGSTAYSTWKQIYTLPYGEDIFDIDISPDGKIMSAAVSDLNGRQSLLFYSLDSLNTGKYAPDTVFNFDISSPQGFRFSQDGKYLYGTSYYSGVSNIFRVETETKNIVPITNSLTGFFRPIEVDTNTLFTFNYSSKGFEPVLIDNAPIENITAIEFLGNLTIEKYPVLKDWELKKDVINSVDVDAVTVKTGKYKPSAMMGLNYAYPTVVGYKDNVGIGYKFNFADPLSLSSIDLEFAYTPKSWENSLSSTSDTTISTLDDDEVFHASFSAKFGRWSFDAGYNAADFYDLFGPTKYSRKGVSGHIGYEHVLIWDGPRNLDLNIGLSAFYGLDQSPEFQQISASGFTDNFYMDVSGSLSYKYLLNSLGAVDYEKGIKWSLQPSATISSGDIFPRATATLDLGFALPVNHASFWIRNATGHSFSDDFNPFTRYGLAAFGNNYVDFRDYRRYRSAYSFPGVSYDGNLSIIARSFTKHTAELILPPMRFRKLGTFNFFANWLQPTIFSSVLLTDDGLGNTGKFANIGGQIDLRMVMFSLLPATFSVGYAKAWNLDTDDNYGEWMFSLKILK